MYESLSPSPLRWSGGPGSGPSFAQGLQHRLCWLHQGCGGGRRGAPPGGGRLKQPQNITLFRRQITWQRQNIEEKQTKKTLPPAPSIAPMSPAVIILYFCILFIAFYMERKSICCFNFCFIYFVLLFFFFKICASIHRTHFFSALAPSSFSKSRHLCEKEIFYSCQFCCFKTNANLKKKPAPFPRSLLEHLWTLLIISGYCLVLVPYLSSTFPKHGLYIHEYKDIHSPVKAGCSVCCSSSVMLQPAGISSQETLYSAPVVHCIFLMGLFRYQSSCYNEKVYSQNHSINPHLTAPKKKPSPLNLNPIRAFSFEI